MSTCLCTDDDDEYVIVDKYVNILWTYWTSHLLRDFIQKLQINNLHSKTTNEIFNKLIHIIFDRNLLFIFLSKEKATNTHCKISKITIK